MRKMYLRAVTTLMFSALSASAGANCEAFARYGIYDTRSSASDVDRAEAFRTWFCQQNFQSEGSAKSAGASLGYGDLTSELSIGYNNSKSTWSQFNSTYCSDSTYSSSMRTKTREFVQSINANATNAMLACFNKPGLHARLEQGVNAGIFRVYTIFNPTNSTVSSARVVNFTVVGGTCSAPLEPGASIGPQGYEMLCTRASSQAVEVSLNANEFLVRDTPMGLPPVVVVSSPERKKPVIVRAQDFVRGQNVAVDQCTPGPGILLNAQPCNARPNAAEFELQANVGGLYRLEAEYAAGAPRGVQIHLNGALVRDQAMGLVTGGWTNDFLRWIEVGNVQLKRGANTMRIERSNVFPHIRSFRFLPVEE